MNQKCTHEQTDVMGSKSTQYCTSTLMSLCDNESNMVRRWQVISNSDTQITCMLNYGQTDKGICCGVIWILFCSISSSSTLLTLSLDTCHVCAVCGLDLVFFNCSSPAAYGLRALWMYFTPVVVWSFPASALDARHLTSNSFLNGWLQLISCWLRARIYKVRCYLNVVEERRSSVRLEIDDRVFSRCRWQRTRSLGYLTVITQSLSVGRSWGTDQPDELTYYSHRAGNRECDLWITYLHYA